MRAPTHASPPFRPDKFLARVVADEYDTHRRTSMTDVDDRHAWESRTRKDLDRGLPLGKDESVKASKLDMLRTQIQDGMDSGPGLPVRGPHAPSVTLSGLGQGVGSRKTPSGRSAGRLAPLSGFM